ncbi:MAG: toxin-antitoxin system YwqK family antitoxin [Myxococcota bacterium]
MQRVPEPDLKYNAEQGIYYYGDRPFTGVAFTTHPSGSLMGETQYEDGLFHGISRGWSRSGKLESEGNYHFGGAHGTLREWHANGQLVEEAEYEYATVVRRKKWDEAGNVIEAYELKESDPAYKSLLLSRRVYGGQGEKGG